MKRDMKRWLEELRGAPVKKAMPVLSFPAIQLMGISVRELISSSDAQARGMQPVSYTHLSPLGLEHGLASAAACLAARRAAQTHREETIEYGF